MANACDKILDSLNKVILDKKEQIRLALACILSRGHLLIEDLPGMGKTTLAIAMSQVLGLDCKRVQFTADMLPADLIGANIFNEETRQFEFHQGPAFTNMLLADEINRGSPRTQSALLEVMAERQISNERTTYKLPEPFFVIATQNPLDQAGTFPLPESQLDRFALCIGLGYPSHEEEIKILKGENKREKLDAVITEQELITMQNDVQTVFVSDAIYEYVLALCEATRNDPEIPNALSPRAALALINAAKAYAFTFGRNYVTPNDIVALFPHVAEHRLRRGTVANLDSTVYSTKILHKVSPVV